MHSLQHSVRLSGPVVLALVATVGCSRPFETPAEGAVNESRPFKGSQPQPNRASDTPGLTPVAGTLDRPQNLPFQPSEELPAGTLLTVKLQTPITVRVPIMVDSFEAVVEHPVVIQGNTLPSVSENETKMAKNQAPPPIPSDGLPLPQSSAPAKPSAILTRPQASAGKPAFADGRSASDAAKQIQKLGGAAGARSADSKTDEELRAQKDGERDAVTEQMTAGNRADLDSRVLAETLCARELRGREQAGRLPRASERLQLEARGAGRASPSCSRRSAAPWVLVSVSDEGFHDADELGELLAGASATSVGSTSTRSATSVRRSGSTTPRARRSAPSRACETARSCLLVGPDRSLVDDVGGAAAGLGDRAGAQREVGRR